MSDPAETALPEPAAAAPVVDDGTPVETPPAVVEPVAPQHTDTPSLLTPVEGEVAPEPAAEPPAAEPAKEPDAPAEEAKEGPKPAEPPAPEPTPPELIVYGEIEAPEGVTFDPARIKALDEVIAPHRLPPEARQELANLHIAEMQRYAEHLSREQHRVFAETRKAWRDEVMADEQIGGSGHQSVIAACMRMIGEFVPDNQRESFDRMLLATGAGDHPAMLRFLNNVARKFDAPATPVPPNNPPPDRGGGRGAGKRLRDLYDHPRSR